MTIRYTNIGALTLPVSTWNPLQEQRNGTFSYIDLGSVDNEEKIVREIKKVSFKDAPSRARQLVKAGDILVSTVRPNLNGLAKLDTRHDGATASTGFCVLRPNPNAVCPNYLFQWLRSPVFVAEMVRQSTGASYPAVSDRIVHSSQIPLPSLEEQRRVAAILDQADDLRRKRREAMYHARSLVDSILIDIVGDPNRNPKGWRVEKLGNICTSISDGPHVSPDYVDTGIPFLSTRNIRKNEVIWEDLRFISREDAEVQWKKAKPVRGDVLYTKGGTTGIACVVDFDTEIAVWVHVAVLKLRHDLVDPTWLQCMLNSSFCYAQSQSLTKGIVNRDLGLRRMVEIQFPLPSLPLQRDFAHRIRAESDQAAS